MTNSAKQEKRRPSLSVLTMTGLGLGLAVGLFLGEICAPLQLVGNIWIQLLQMAILPYILCSLIAAIGRLTYQQAGRIASRAGVVLVAVWMVTLVVIFLMPLAFPETRYASFYSTSLIEQRGELDLLALYIPANPFRSLSESVVPAIVLFSIALGVALIGVQDKERIVGALGILVEALSKVTTTVVRLSPLGVFAIAASAAGTTTLEEFGRLQVYFTAFVIAVLSLTFWFLPALLAYFTPLRYGDFLRASRTTLITAFTTGSFFICLPLIIASCKEQLAEVLDDHEGAQDQVDVLVPIAFNFPTAGKLLSLLFVLFGAWFTAADLGIPDVAFLAVSGLLSLFASAHIAIPYLLDSLQLPADLYQLFVVAGVVAGRFGTMLAAMSLTVFTLLATVAVTQGLRPRWRRFPGRVAASLAILVVVVLGTRAILARTVRDIYTKDQVIAGMQRIQLPAMQATVLEETTAAPEEGRELPALERIRRRGLLRVGYVPQALPFTYFNSAGELVGMDAEMAYLLARDLEVRLEFIPTDPQRMTTELAERRFDLVMSGLAVTPLRLRNLEMVPVTKTTIALVVPDHRRKEFTRYADLLKMQAVKIAVPNEFFRQRLAELLPEWEVVFLPQVDRFFTDASLDADALLATAETGSAWTLLYPDYSVVVPQPNMAQVELGWALPRDERDFAEFLSRWRDFHAATGNIQDLWNHWILGRGSEVSEPRWSVIRNVLGWVD